MAINDTKFSFDPYGNLASVNFDYMQFILILYTSAATLIHYTKGRVRKENEVHSKEYDLCKERSIDGIIEEYTNWADGCAFYNTMRQTANFLHDFVAAIAASEKWDAISTMCSDKSYNGYAIHGSVKHHGVEIITDALQSYGEYIGEVKYYAENNRKFLKVCGALDTSNVPLTTLDLLRSNDWLNAFYDYKRKHEEVDSGNFDAIMRAFCDIAKEEEEK